MLSRSLAVASRPAAARATAALASLVAAAWLVLVVFFLPAFAAAQPNRAIVADVARERQHRPDLRMAFCSDPTRVRRDVLLHVRLAALSECDLWSLAGSREPFLLLATPAQDASFRADPRYREIARYRYVPASALTLGGLFALREPGEIVLGANFATTDPVAERKRKREYRKAIQEAQRGAWRGAASPASVRPTPGTPPPGRDGRADRRAWARMAPSGRRLLVLVVAEEEEVGASLAAEDPPVLAASAVLADGLEADRALRERHFLLVLLTDDADHGETGAV